MSMEAHQSHVLNGGAKSGRTGISIPEMPSPAPNHREKLIFTEHQEKEPPNTTLPCSDKGVLLTNGGFISPVGDGPESAKCMRSPAGL